MTEIQKIRRRPVDAETMQLIVGVTTRSQILEFCPTANVGVGSRHTSQGPELDELDLRWVQIPHGPIRRFVDAHDGEWIVRCDGIYEVHTTLSLASQYDRVP